MSARRYARLASRLQQAAADAAWVQWRVLGGQVAARLPASIVDPEALLLVSLAMSPDEPRLLDLLSGFAGSGTDSISIQRLRRLATAFPPRVSDDVGRFARSATAAGDHRWARLAAGKPLAPGRAGKVGNAAERILERGSLMLRLRTAFGVDVRADVLAYLLGIADSRAGIGEMTVELGYAANSIRGACEALVESGLILGGPERPARYHVRWRRWQQFLDLERTPWFPWGRAYALVTALRDWLRSHEAREPSGDVERMLFREWREEHRKDLALLEIGTTEASLDTVVEVLTGLIETRA